MAAKRRKIDMVGQENFRITMENPNASVGLPGCACGSHRCPPPFAVFPMRLNQGTRPGYVSVSLACVKKAVVKYERGDEIQAIGSQRPGEDSTPGKIEAVEDSSNPYFQTGIDPSARPLHIVQTEIEQVDIAERARQRQAEYEAADAVGDHADERS